MIGARRCARRSRARSGTCADAAFALEGFFETTTREPYRSFQVSRVASSSSSTTRGLIPSREREREREKDSFRRLAFGEEGDSGVVCADARALLAFDAEFVALLVDLIGDETSDVAAAARCVASRFGQFR